MPRPRAVAGAVVADLGGLVLREIDRMQRIAGPRSVVSGGSEGSAVSRLTAGRSWFLGREDGAVTALRALIFASIRFEGPNPRRMGVAIVLCRTDSAHSLRAPYAAEAYSE
jgi:hypothetical protein